MWEREGMRVDIHKEEKEKKNDKKTVGVLIQAHIWLNMQDDLTSHKNVWDDIYS